MSMVNRTFARTYGWSAGRRPAWRPATWTELCTVNCRRRHVHSRPGLPDFRHLALQVVVSVHGNRAYLTLTAAPADGRQRAPNTLFQRARERCRVFLWLSGWT